MKVLYSIQIQSTLLKRALEVNAVSTRSAVDLAYKIHGASPIRDPIFVLHGLLGSKKNWESMCKRIATETKVTVVAVDARNHGESPHASTHSYLDLASDVSKLMDTLSQSQATIIGHSMGGRTGMVLALTEPSKVKKLVVVDISPISTPGNLSGFFPNLIDVMKRVQFKPGVNASNARVSAAKQMQKAGLLDDISSFGFILMNVGNKRDNTVGWVCNLDTLKNSFESIATFPSELMGKVYPGPVLFIAGKLSNYVPPSDISSIRGLFPKAQLQYVPNVGHNVHAEDPAAFFSMVTKFLAEN